MEVTLNHAGGLVDIRFELSGAHLDGERLRTSVIEANSAAAQR